MSEVGHKKVAILGSGLIGSSWAMVFASAGYRVSVFDVDEGRIRAALEEIAGKLEELEKSGSLRGKLCAKSQLALIKGAASLKEAVEDAFFIQESVPEVFEIKRKVLEQVDPLVGNDVIISSSASALLPSKLSEGLKHKNRFLVSHPANPPYFVPIVELVPAPWTDPDVVTRTKALMSEVEQSPIVCKKEQLGYALCRMQYAIINECWRLVRDGYLSVEDIDTVMTEGLGRRYALLGPFETAHLNAEGMGSYLEKYGNMIYDVSKTLGPAPRLEGPEAEKIDAELSRLVPLQRLEARRKWRDESLAALSKLRSKFN